MGVEVPDCLDVGIARAVRILMEAGIETYESCQGGADHAYTEPTVRFHGERGEGFRALAVALTLGLPVSKLARIWNVNDGEPTGPHWEMVFSRMVPETLRGDTPSGLDKIRARVIRHPRNDERGGTYDVLDGDTLIASYHDVASARAFVLGQNIAQPGPVPDPSCGATNTTTGAEAREGSISPLLGVSADARPANQQDAGGGHAEAPVVAFPAKLHAPWNHKQVTAINRFQNSGCVHPFTCRSGDRTNAAHGKRRGTLIANSEGFFCTGCEYTQDWCDPIMADTEHVERMIRSHAETFHAPAPSCGASSREEDGAVSLECNWCGLSPDYGRGRGDTCGRAIYNDIGSFDRRCDGTLEPAGPEQSERGEPVQKFSVRQGITCCSCDTVFAVNDIGYRHRDHWCCEACWNEPVSVIDATAEDRESEMLRRVYMASFLPGELRQAPRDRGLRAVYECGRAGLSGARAESEGKT